MNAAAPSLSDIRACLEGAIPAVLSTCGADGLPNVAYISQVFYVDEQHVALSFQFFNKTRQNILANPQATALLMHPVTAAFYRLHIRYLRTESEGPLFESMRAQLAGIASHTGMEGVFRLLGSDVYAVEQIEALPGEHLPPGPVRTGRLGALRRLSDRLSRCSALEEALDAALDSATQALDTAHAMLLMWDAKTERLYTVASRGYATSGVGSEIGLGQGVIGVAARERTPVRIMHMTTASLYSQAVRSSLASGGDLELATEIPYPGLAQPHSQLAVPLLCGGQLLGVLFVESPRDLQFGYEDEDLLVAMAGHLAAVIELNQAHAEAAEPPATLAAAEPPDCGATLQVKRFASNDSIFVNGHYLIKGVAGAILWKLVREYLAQGRTEFSNRELRLDASIGLPDLHDNLEARLILLQRRLDEQGPHLRIEKTGRGRFRLAVGCALQLAED